MPHPLKIAEKRLKQSKKFVCAPESTHYAAAKCELGATENIARGESTGEECEMEWMGCLVPSICKAWLKYGRQVA